MNDVAEEFPTKSHADVIEFYYNWKFHEPDYSRWQFTKRQIDIALVSGSGRQAPSSPDADILMFWSRSGLLMGVGVGVSVLTSIPRLGCLGLSLIAEAGVSPLSLSPLIDRRFRIPALLMLANNKCPSTSVGYLIL